MADQLEDDIVEEKSYVPNAGVRIKRENLKQHRTYKEFIEEERMEGTLRSELRSNAKAAFLIKYDKVQTNVAAGQYNEFDEFMFDDG